MSSPSLGASLHNVHLFRLGVVVELEADLVAVEGHRSVDVADREDDDFQGPIHEARPPGSGLATYLVMG